MNCVVKPTVCLSGLAGGIQANPTGAGFTAQAPDQHADRGSETPLRASTGGGWSVRNVFPLTSLIELDRRLPCAPVVRFFGGVAA